MDSGFHAAWNNGLCCASGSRERSECHNIYYSGENNTHYKGLIHYCNDCGKRLEKAIKEKSIKGIIIKPNQIGTLSETLDTMKLARDNDIDCIVSHRSGETMDDFIGDLSVAFGCFGIKAGALGPKERNVKYERIIKITSK